MQGKAVGSKRGERGRRKNKASRPKNKEPLQDPLVSPQSPVGSARSAETGVRFGGINATRATLYQ